MKIDHPINRQCPLIQWLRVIVFALIFIKSRQAVDDVAATECMYPFHSFPNSKSQGDQRRHYDDIAVADFRKIFLDLEGVVVGIVEYQEPPFVMSRNC